MRLFVAVMFALVALANAGEDKYERMLKKWVKCKAMEGCFGEENTKKFVVKMKKAKAVCSGKPAPELHLPMFQKKVRVTNALLGLTAQQNEFIDEKIRQEFITKLMAKEMGDVMEDSALPYAANKYAMRFTREADEDEEMDEMDVADMMVDKLGGLKDKFESEIGNMTCVMKEIGVIDENNEIDVPAMDKCLDEGKYTAEESADGVDRTWLQAKLKEVHVMCKELSDAVPQSILDSCSLPHWMTRLKFFHKCAKFHKIEACMHSDMRHKIGKNGMGVEKLAKRAGMKEDEIVTLMAAMLYKH